MSAVIYDLASRSVRPDASAGAAPDAGEPRTLSERLDVLDGALFAVADLALGALGRDKPRPGQSDVQQSERLYLALFDVAELALDALGRTRPS